MQGAKLINVIIQQNTGQLKGEVIFGSSYWLVLEFAFFKVVLAQNHAL